MITARDNLVYIRIFKNTEGTGKNIQKFAFDSALIMK